MKTQTNKKEKGSVISTMGIAVTLFLFGYLAEVFAVEYLGYVNIGIIFILSISMAFVVHFCSFMLYKSIHSLDEKAIAKTP